MSTLSNSIIDQNYEELVEAFDDALGIYASAYTETTVRNFTDRATDSLKSVKMLNGSNKSDKLDELGNKLYDDLIQQIEAIGEPFERAIQINLNCKNQVNHVLQERNNLQEELAVFETHNAEEHIKPEKDMYLYQASELFKTQFADMQIEYDNTENTRITKAEFEAKKKDLAKEQESYGLKNYYEALVRYDLAISTKNKNLHLMRERKKLISNMIVKEILLKTYVDANFQLIGKINYAVLQFPQLKVALNGTTTINATIEKIVSPLASYKLAGVMAILYEQFRKQGIVSLTTSLVSAFEYKLTEKEVSTDCTLALQFCDKLLSDWVRKDLFSQITMDQLMCSVLINTLPKGPTKNSLFEEVDSYNLRLHNGDTTAEDESEDLQLYYRLSKVLKQRKQRQDFPSNKNAYDKYKRDQIENAAAGEIADSVSLYTTEILKSKGITYKDKQNRIHTYIAVSRKSLICDKCYPESGSANTCEKNGKVKQCYAIQCNTCKLFGHKSEYCKQKV